jgi:uncharacterized protein (DUF849 family)
VTPDTIVTCAVTGGGDTTRRHPGVPVTPRQIADACREAANAGAAIVHLHVRDPETGQQSRDPDLFRQAVELVREDGTDVLINVTTGIGGDFVPSEADPATGGPGTDMLGPLERLAHLDGLDADLCTLDCGSMNYGEELAYVAPFGYLRRMAARLGELGIKPELEVFELGHLGQAGALVEEGLIASPPLVQICLGVAGGAPATPKAMIAMRDELPSGAVWFGFGVGRAEMPMVAQAVLLGGNVRVGLEDNLYLGRGQLASNGELVDRAVSIVRALGGEIASADRARSLLGLGSGS